LSHDGKAKKRINRVWTFSNFAKALIAVPRKELQEQIQKYKRSKKNRTAIR
jgi:hypothetical protein